MPVFDRGGARLRYRVRGDGPPLLLVPGFNGTADFWDPVVQRLESRWRVVLPDYRNTLVDGVQQALATDAGRMAGDLVAVLDHAGVEQVHVAGHSFGSALCQLLAVQAPRRVERLLLSATFSRLHGVPRRWFELRRRVLDDCGLEAFIALGTLATYGPDWLQRNFDAVQAREAAIARSSPPAQVLRDRMDALLRFDSRALLPSLRVPTLVLAADDDALTPVSLSAEVAQAIHGARLRVLKQGGHSFPRTEPDAYVAVLQQAFSPEAVR